MICLTRYEQDSYVAKLWSVERVVFFNYDQKVFEMLELNTVYCGSKLLPFCSKCFCYERFAIEYLQEKLGMKLGGNMKICESSLSCRFHGINYDMAL